MLCGAHMLVLRIIQELWQSSGGVFNVDDAGQAVIPIKASLVVDQPYLFAVTVERPGGVAKSAKEQVPIIAAPPSDA